MSGDPDAPDPNDWTMHRLELVNAFDEVFPQWRNMVGEGSRDGWPVGWLHPDTPISGVLLDDAVRAGTNGDESVPAVALPWRDDVRYFVLRPDEAPHLWARVLPRYPATYTVDAFLPTTVAETDSDGVRCQRLLTPDDQPVLLTDADGTHPRPWLLRDDRVFDLARDIEGGWQVWAQEHHDNPGAAPSET